MSATGKNTLVRKALKRILSEEDARRFEVLRVHDLGLGYDKFGMNLDVTLLAYGIVRYIYDYYFRVESSGHENIPTEGRTILCGNHSGTLPLDAMMIAVDIAAKLDPPRIMRAIVERFAASLPFVSLFFARAGQVIGTRRNFQELLKDEEMIIVFPEGAKGVAKPYRLKYQLQYFNVGFVELALQNKAPLVPVAVVGAEEQFPMIGNIKPLADALGFPAVPITPTFPLFGPIGAVPLPVKYHIRYGEPIYLHEKYPEDVLTQPKMVRQLADEVKATIQGMVNQGLEERKGIFS